MARAKIAEDGQGRFYGIRITCPGCGHLHTLPTPWTPDGYERSPYVANKPQWEFNGDFDRPTFAPSILSRTGHYIGDGKPGNCYCTAPDPDFTCGVCHSFVRDGRIQFLADCTHALASQTVDLSEIQE